MSSTLLRPRAAGHSYFATGDPVAAPTSARAGAIGASTRRVAAVAMCELRLQWRAPALWVLGILLALATASVAYVQGPHQRLIGIGAHSSADAAVAVCRADALFAATLLPWLFMGTFARDRRRRFSPLLWTRPLTPVEYALGKGLAGLGLGLLVGLLPLLGGWMVLGLAYGARQPVGPWLASFPIVATTTLLVSAFALVSLALTSRPLLGALGGAGLLFYLAAVRAQTLLALMNLSATTVFYSPAIGFGPDNALLRAQHLTYLVLALLCLLLLPIVFVLREHRAALRATVGPRLLATLALAIIVASSSVVHFRAVAAGYQPLGPAPAAPTTAHAEGYRLAMTLDPLSGRLDGTATLLMDHPPSDAREVYFALNPGLTVARIDYTDPATAATAPVPFTSAAGWIRLQLGGTPYARNLRMRLSITYGGRLALGRDDYALVEPGVFTLSGHLAGGRPVTSYNGQGVALLGGDGDWYPRLWAEEVLAAVDARQQFEAISIRLPAALRVWCPLASATTAEGGWQTLDTHPAGVLPLAFLAALPAPHQLTAAEPTVSYAGAAPDAGTIRRDLLMLQQVVALDNWLGSRRGAAPTRNWSGVVMPLIRQPIVGPGLLLLPEQSADAAPTEVAEYRMSAQASAEAWWRNAAQMRSRTPAFGNTPPSLQAPTGRAWFGQGQPPLLAMLATYSGAVLTERALGEELLAHEVTIRQRFHAAFLQRRAGGGPASAGSDPATSRQIDEEMRRLGLNGVAGDPALALFALSQELGSERTTVFLREFATQYTQRPADAGEFIQAANVTVGRNFAPEVIQYLRPNTP